VISQWLLLTILMISLYMGLGKRRNELKKTQGDTTRAVLKFYTAEYLGRIMLMTLTLGLAFYSLWTALVVVNGDIMIWTVPLVIAIMMKYELDLAGDSYGDPVDVVSHDKAIIVMVLVYIAVVMGSLYLIK